MGHEFIFAYALNRDLRVEEYPSNLWSFGKQGIAGGKCWYCATGDIDTLLKGTRIFKCSRLVDTDYGIVLGRWSKPREIFRV